MPAAVWSGKVKVTSGPAALAGLIVRWIAVLTLGGIAVGLAGAIAAGRLLAGTLYGVQPTDTATLALAVSLLKALAPFMLSLTMLAQEGLSDVEQVDGLEAATG